MQITSVQIAGIGDAIPIRISLGTRDQSPEWLEGQVAVNVTAHSNYAALQRVALDKLRTAIDAEIQRLEEMRRSLP